MLEDSGLHRTSADYVWQFNDSTIDPDWADDRYWQTSDGDDDQPTAENSSDTSKSTSSNDTNSNNSSDEETTSAEDTASSEEDTASYSDDDDYDEDYPMSDEDEPMPPFTQHAPPAPAHRPRRSDTANDEFQEAFDGEVYSVNNTVLYISGCVSHNIVCWVGCSCYMLAFSHSTALVASLNVLHRAYNYDMTVLGCT